MIYPFSAILLLFIACLVFPRTRGYYLFIVRSSFEDLWEIVVDYTPSKHRKVSIGMVLLMIVLLLPVAMLFAIVCFMSFPTVSMIHSFKHPEEVDDILQFDKDLHAPRPVKPKRTPEEIAEATRIWIEKMMATRFDVDRKDIPFNPDEHEVFFFTPVDAREVENAISSQYQEIKSAFEQRHLNFVFLPYFNKELNEMLNADKVSYYNPNAADALHIPVETLSYQDIKEALKIPEKVDGPCFIRCKRKDTDPLIFSFHKIELPEDGDMMPVVQEYLSQVGDGRYFQHLSKEEIERRVEGVPADERFDTDIYLIGQEIKERLEKLRAKGLSTLAIRKLIGDDADKPGKLLIDKHHKLILTDFGNKEIKLEPLQKTVFFLFLRHPEGIYFKDLGDYREELGAIYREITGREDIAGVQDSINKLTDPLDNSINEKCARIKNAFVAEFREEVAQWYFIAGKRGEKKTIKLPRDLVTWETKD